jgi:hypothetical protein
MFLWFAENNLNTEESSKCSRAKIEWEDGEYVRKEEV